MKTASLALGLIVLSLGLTACQPGRSLVGKWNSETSPVPGVSQTLEFKADKTATVNLIGNAGGMNLDAKIKATWDLKGETLSFVATEIDLGAISSMAPAGMVDQMKNEMGKKNSGTIQWTDNDTVTMTTADGTSMKYTRVK